MDYKYKLPYDDADREWNYKWSYAECGTPNPQPNEQSGGSSLFMVLNNEAMGSVAELKLVMETLRQSPRIKENMGDLTVTVSDKDENNPGRRTVTGTMDSQIVFEGFVTTPIEEQGGGMMDGNIGNYALLHSRQMKGMAVLRFAQMISRHGCSAVIDHARHEFDIGNNLKLITVSGLGDLATRFHLMSGSDEVARCHMSYRDGSYDSSVGPTIEMMEAHRDHRGKSYVPILWYWVRCFIEENCTLECMNSNVPENQVMIKCTQLNNTVVDVNPVTGEAVTDKEFFYRYAGFSVRQQVGVMARIMGGRRPADEEAVLYIPLLTREAINQRTLYETPSEALEWREHHGKRACDCCGKLQLKVSRCARCKQSYYCSPRCQKADWAPRHKFMCCKSKEEIEEKLEAEGFLRRMEDGRMAMCPRPF
jgi:hypothetical protein